MSQLTLYTASIVFVENNLLLSPAVICLGVMMNRICRSVGLRELASDSDLLEGHISFFMPRRKSEVLTV